VSAPEIRPHFEVYVASPMAEVLARLEAHVESSEGAVRGWVNAPYAELRVPAGDKELWSPRLAIYAEELSDGVTLLCRLQPEPDVWTMYVALWSALGIATLCVGSYAVSQWVMGATPWVAIIGFPIVLAIAGTVYGIALVGQKLGRPQMQLLCRHFNEALDELSPKIS
jgi:hypothetical protein